MSKINKFGIQLLIAFLASLSFIAVVNIAYARFFRDERV